MPPPLAPSFPDSRDGLQGRSGPEDIGGRFPLLKGRRHGLQREHGGPVRRPGVAHVVAALGCVTRLAVLVAPAAPGARLGPAPGTVVGRRRVEREPAVRQPVVQFRTRRPCDSRALARSLLRPAPPRPASRAQGGFRLSLFPVGRAAQGGPPDVSPSPQPPGVTPPRQAPAPEGPLPRSHPDPDKPPPRTNFRPGATLPQAIPRPGQTSAPEPPCATQGAYPPCLPPPRPAPPRTRPRPEPAMTVSRRPGSSVSSNPARPPPRTWPRKRCFLTPRTGPPDTKAVPARHRPPHRRPSLYPRLDVLDGQHKRL